MSSKNNWVPISDMGTKEIRKLAYQKRIQQEKESRDLIKDYLEHKEEQDQIDRYEEI
jgi:hypothetical protein